jgi:hypothetical protein
MERLREDFFLTLNTTTRSYLKMANATVSRLGQANLTGATDALFLKKFAGEILTMFEQTTVMLDKHLVKTIENGKSASFPLTGTVTGG